MPDLKITATRGSEIVTTANAKDFIRIDTSDDDTLIATMIKQARIWCENYLTKDIVAKTRQYYLEDINKRFSLPFAPISSITSITVEGSAATYDTYGVNGDIIELDELPAKDIIVTYVTSGVDTELLQQAILQLVATYYDNRSDFIVMQGVSAVKIPSDVKNILSSEKTMFI